MKLKISIIVFIAALAALPVFAEKVSMPSLSMPTAASNGFGGHHVAYTDNVFSLLVNPAAMKRVQQRSFFTLAPSLLSPQATADMVSPVMDLAGGDTSALGNAAQILSDRNGKVSLGFELREFPLSFAWVANGFGFGLWNRVFVNANIRGTYIDANVFADVMLPVGFAFKILDVDRHSVDAGVTVKPFVRTVVHETEKITNLASNSEDFVEDLNVPVIIGGGFDMGFLYRWDAGLQAGLTFSDIFSRGKVVYNSNQDKKDTNTYYIPFAMNLGVSYHYDYKFLGVTVAADWHDMTNVFNQDDYLEHRNYKLDFGAGLELSLFKMIYFRIGMSEMLPATGIGFSFGPCKIDLAYYGRELGMEPGQLSAATVELSVSIRPGAKKRDWLWTRRSVVGLITGIEKAESGGGETSVTGAAYNEPAALDPAPVETVPEAAPGEAASNEATVVDEASAGPVSDETIAGDPAADPALEEIIVDEAADGEVMIDENAAVAE